MSGLGKLSGLQKRILREAILETFDRDDLALMVSDRLDAKLDVIVGSGRLEKQVFDLIEWARQRAKLDRLIDAVTAERPELASTLSFSAPPPAATAEPSRLERLVRNGEGIDRLGPMIERFLALQGQVCRIEAAVGGTGFLVAPDLVLTNYHVLQREIASQDFSGVVCRFDFLSESSRGVAVRPVAAGCCLAYAAYAPADESKEGRPPVKGELDYALIRLSRPVGNDPVDGKDRVRGTVAVSASAAVPAEQRILFIAQHPESGPLSSSWGLSRGAASGGLRMRYTAETLAGSSGSPVFDGDLSLVALHHAGEPGSKLQPGEYNQGIPISLIVADLAEKAVQRFWE
jgi:Trypsin-like peptidase domain/Effector-associated domain 1